MSDLRKRLRGLYGSGPLHLIAVVASFAVAGYVVLKLADSPARWKLLLWFLASVALHDLVLFPLYTLLDRIAQGRRPRAAVNYLRVPVLLSGLLLLISAGLVFSRAPTTYELATGLEPTPYLERWLAITAVLFVASGILYALRARSTRSLR
jgi:hypothetical protein